jgi:ABC-type uncharacterized transport system substrate-binding protein
MNITKFIVEIDIHNDEKDLPMTVGEMNDRILEGFESTQYNFDVVKISKKNINKKIKKGKV